MKQNQFAKFLIYIILKELSLFHKLKFVNPYIFAT